MERTRARSGLSIVVRYGSGDSSRQALRTVGPSYQRSVSAGDYTVFVVGPQEHDDSTPEDPAGNVRIARPQAAERSPLEAAREILRRHPAELVGLMLDGLPQLTPRVVRYALDAFAITPHALVTVPGYTMEAQSSDGPSSRPSGYGLFELAAERDPELGKPLWDPERAGCLFVSADRLASVVESDMEGSPGSDERIGPRLCRILLERTSPRWFVLPGEGAFFAGHGPADHGDPASAVPPGDGPRSRRRPELLGAVTGPALPFVEMSARTEAGAGRRPPNVPESVRPGQVRARRAP